jgi:hypothetical protein
MVSMLCNDDTLPSNREDFIEIETENGMEKSTKYDVKDSCRSKCYCFIKGFFGGSTLYVNLFPCNDCAKIILLLVLRRLFTNKRGMINFII